MEKTPSVFIKREQHRIEIRADKLAKDLNLKRQKFSSSIQNPSTIKQNASNEILNKLYNQFSENLVLNNEEKMIEALKEFKQIMLEETCTDFVNTEVFVSGFYKHLIGLLDSNFNKNHNLLSEVLWILINLSCVTDEEKLNMLFREKLITKLINLIKIDENSPLTDDILWCLSNTIQISEEAKHDIINEGIMEISLKRLNVSKDYLDFVKVNNFSILFLKCSDAKPLIKYEQIKKYLPVVIGIFRVIKENDIIWPSLLAISCVFTNYGEFLDEIIQIFVNMNAHLVAKELFDDKNTNKKFLITLLKVFGSIANGNENAVKVLYEIGLLKSLNFFLSSSSLKIRHLTAWTISNMMSSNEIIATQVFLFEDVFEKFLKILITDEEIVKIEALYCIDNLLAYKNQNQIDFFLERNIIRLMIDAIKVTESAKLIILVLDCLEKFMCYEHSNKNYHIILMKMLEESGGMTKFEELQHHPDEAVYKKLEIVLKNFSD